MYYVYSYRPDALRAALRGYLFGQVVDIRETCATHSSSHSSLVIAANFRVSLGLARYSVAAGTSDHTINEMCPIFVAISKVS